MGDNFLQFRKQSREYMYQMSACKFLWLWYLDSGIICIKKNLAIIFKFTVYLYCYCPYKVCTGALSAYPFFTTEISERKKNCWKDQRNFSNFKSWDCLQYFHGKTCFQHQVEVENVFKKILEHFMSPNYGKYK